MYELVIFNPNGKEQEYSSEIIEYIMLNGNIKLSGKIKEGSILFNDAGDLIGVFSDLNVGVSLQCIETYFSLGIFLLLFIIQLKNF